MSPKVLVEHVLRRQTVPRCNVIAKSASNRLWWIPAVAVMGLLVQIPLLASEPNGDATFDSDHVIAAFAASSDGYSSDELLIRDDLRQRFLESLAGLTAISIDSDAERSALLHLLRLRKAGKLDVPATRRAGPTDDSVTPIAEIASRVVMDRHRITSDTMLADSNHRRELQREAELISPDVDAYAVRKSVLTLRKRRALRPELVLRVADWERRLQTFSLLGLRSALAAGDVPKQPGVYIFRSPDGYLYVGEAADLSKRLGQHVAKSDRKSLANYLNTQAENVSVELHVFPRNSPAARVAVRRAYESELIRSRNPRFNVRP
jgi:hypothetical protein